MQRGNHKLLWFWDNLETMVPFVNMINFVKIGSVRCEFYRLAKKINTIFGFFTQGKRWLKKLDCLLKFLSMRQCGRYFNFSTGWPKIANNSIQSGEIFFESLILPVNRKIQAIFFRFQLKFFVQNFISLPILRGFFWLSQKRYNKTLIYHILNFGCNWTIIRQFFCERNLKIEENLAALTRFLL